MITSLVIALKIIYIYVLTCRKTVKFSEEAPEIRLFDNKDEDTPDTEMENGEDEVEVDPEAVKAMYESLILEPNLMDQAVYVEDTEENKVLLENTEEMKVLKKNTEEMKVVKEEETTPTTRLVFIIRINIRVFLNKLDSIPWMHNL